MWLGASVVNQEEANRDIPKLLHTPAAIRFLSCEPLLDSIDLTKLWVRMPGGGEVLWNSLATLVDERKAIDWVIVGGESGPRSRPMDVHWARAIRHQCEAAGAEISEVPDDGVQLLGQLSCSRMFFSASGRPKTATRLRA